MGGQNSREIFTSSFESLKEENLDQKPEEFWEKLWTVPTSVDDIFSLNPDKLRSFRKSHPQNFSLLVEKIVRRLLHLCHNYKEEESNQLLNCVRLLTRLNPLIFEDPQEGFSNQVYWTKKIEVLPVSKDGKQEEPDNPKDESRDGENKTPSVTVVPILEPLAVCALKTIVELLFLPGFTVSIPSTPPPKTSFLLPLDYVWSTGVGSSEVMGSSSLMVIRRTEVLKCLTSYFSESLYSPSEKLKTTENTFLHYVACNSSYYSLALFYSLLNVGCNYDPVGWGIPYNHLLSADYQEELTDVSLQILALLLNYHPQSVNNHKNIFSGYLQSIRRNEDFKFLTDAFVKLLNNPLQANRTYFPHSTKSIECHHEIVMLLWKLLQSNKGYLEYLCLQPECLKIITPVLHFILQGRKDPSQVQLVQLASFVLLVLSGERDFSVALNSPFTEKSITGLPPFVGNHGDFLILVIHKLFVDSHERLAPFFECFLTIVTNVSPYIKSLSMVTSMNLLKLFEHVTRPRFIFANENNYLFTIFILEIFNNIIQYQYEGNNKLVYSLLRHSNSFQKVANLQLSDQPKPKKKENETVPKEEDLTTMEKIEETHVESQSFVPTEEWLNKVKQQLPINISLKLVEALEPKIRTLVTGSAEDEEKILTFLHNNTIVGILPVPHPIVIRKYVDNDATNEWFTLFTYSVIVKRSFNPPVYSGTKYVLFTLSQSS